jgi:hypothetical protein
MNKKVGLRLRTGKRTLNRFPVNYVFHTLGRKQNHLWISTKLQGMSKISLNTSQFNKRADENIVGE